MHALISELDRAGGSPQQTVLVIDEAGIASTRIAAAIFAHAERADTKIRGPTICPGRPISVETLETHFLITRVLRFGRWTHALSGRVTGRSVQLRPW